MREQPGRAVRQWVRDWAGPLLVVAGTLALYHRLLAPDVALLKRDAARFFLPLKQYMAERLLTGELPQWFPYEGLGRSFLGATVTGVFHPFTLLYLVLSPPAAYRLSVLCACLLAALGAYALGRQWRYSRAAAVMAGLAFACSGYVASLTENIVYLYSICLLPLFCASLERALAEGRAWLIAPACLWASVWLNGDAQTGYYYGWIALGWSLWHRGNALRGPLLRWAGVAGLALLLGGVQLAVSAGEFLASSRAHPASFQDETMRWSTHPLRLLTMTAGPVGSDDTVVAVAHYFFGSAPAGGAPVGYWAESLYLGLPVLGLAVLGGWARRDLRACTWLGALALALALGRYGGLYALCSHVVPFWSAFRYPEKLMGVATFAIAMLAGAGVDAVREGRGGPRAWLIAAACAGGLGALLLIEGGGWLAQFFSAPPDVAQLVAQSAGRAWLFSAATSLAVGLLLLAARCNQLRVEWLVAGLLLLVAGDLSRVNLAAYRTGPSAAVQGEPGLAGAVRNHAGREGFGQFRILTIWDPRGAVRYPSVFRDTLDHYGVQSMRLRQGLDVEYGAQFHFESMKAYLPGFSVALGEVVNVGRLDPRVYARYNVAYFLGPREVFAGPLFADKLVAYAEEFDLALVGNPAPVMPRAYLSRRPDARPDAVAMRGLMADHDFLEGMKDVVESPAAGLPVAPEIPSGAVRLERYEPEVIRLNVDTPRTAVLVLNDGFASGWTALLETGEELPVLRANGLVRAAVVPAGNHTVTFHYATPGLSIGAAATALGLILCIGLAWRHARSAHQWSVTNPSVQPGSL